MDSSDAPAPEIRYTVFIKVPIPRRDFVDPPAVHWDSAKDRALWKVLSSSGKGSEIDWHALADQFDVPLPFLLQQSAWLYEQQLSQVREQLRKAKPSVASGASPVPPSISGSVSAGGVAVGRVSSGGSRVPSSLSVRARESPNLRDDLSAPSTPTLKAPPFSRTSSTNTVYQTQRIGSGPHLRRESSPRPSRLSLETERPSSKDSPTSRRSSLRPHFEPEPEPSSPLVEPSSPSSSSSSSSDDPIPLSRSRVFPRRPRFSTNKPATTLSSADEDDEDDDPPAFLPFSIATKPSTRDAAFSSHPPRLPQTDPSATLRLSHRSSRPPIKPSSSSALSKEPMTDPPLSSSTAITTNNNNHPTSSSPTSSSTSLLPTSSSNHNNTRPPILSPRQRQALIKEGSDGAPSMGSSFSDLDDASMTQSALEEALVREMGQGGGSSAAGSRISLVGVGRALRSRYL